MGSMTKLPHDWREFIASLTSRRVRFVIVGAHAMAQHGVPRTTQDLDVFVEPTLANARRLGAALADFGYPAAARAWRQFAKPGRMATLGVPPLQIDVMNVITGVSFRTAWKHRTVVAQDGMEVGYLDVARLVANKRASGRAKDLADLALLEEAGITAAPPKAPTARRDRRRRPARRARGRRGARRGSAASGRARR